MKRKKNKNSYFDFLHRWIRFFYNSLEKPFSLTFKKNYYRDKNFIKMNRFMKYFLKHKELMVKESMRTINKKITTSDGKEISLIIYLNEAAETPKFIVGNHWFTGHKYWMFYLMQPFIKMGYSIVAFDFRNHGDSERGTHMTMGIEETNDLLAVLNYLKTNYEYDHIGIYGISMGAFVLNYAAIKYKDILKWYKVKFGISDVAYGSIETLIMHIRNKKANVLFPKYKSKKYVEYLINFQTDKTGVEWSDGNVFSLLEKEGVVPDFPMLYIHGQSDGTTPTFDTLRLYMDRMKHIEDWLIIYNYSIHGLSTKFHFETNYYNMLEFICTVNNDFSKFKELVEFYKLDKKDVDKNEINTFILK